MGFVQRVRAAAAAALLATGVGSAAAAPSQQGGPTASTAQATTAQLEFSRLEVHADQAAPQACLVFQSRLQRAGTPGPESLVKIEPAIALTARIDGNRLCLGGFAHGSTYQVTLAPGLAALNGAALTRPVQVQVAVPNREPAIAFAGRGLILPRYSAPEAAKGLPLRTVNVERTAITLLRIRDRDLLRPLAAGTIGAPLTPDMLTRLIERDAERVWRGEIDTHGEPNKARISYLSLADTIGPAQPGLYVAVAASAGQSVRSDAPRPTQWFSVSDLGLTAYHGDETLVVSVRSLGTAQAVANVEVAVIADNNRELARVRADGEGMARFDPAILRGTAGDRPRTIYAYGDKGDFSWLDLSGSQRIDLADRGVGGRTARGPVEAFLYSDRGIYRPGETVRLVALLRDEQARAAARQTPTLRITRPDGAIVDTRTLPEQASGAFQTEWTLAPNAARGIWSVAALLPPAPGDIQPRTMGTYSFRVEEPAAPRVEFDLRIDAAQLQPATPTHVVLEARYPHGAAASDLTGELAVALRPAETPFPSLPGYRWGLQQEAPVHAARDPIAFRTNAQGQAELDLTLAQVPDTTLPLEAVVTASSVDAGGRAVEQLQAIPVANLPFAIGVKPLFDGSSAPENTAFGFEAIAVSPEGTRIERGELAWEIVREDAQLVWTRTGTAWEQRASLQPTRIAGGALSIAADSPAKVEQTLPAGAYRIEVYDPTGPVATSQRFVVGAFPAPDRGGAPEQVTLVPAKPGYAAGETGEVFIKPPYEADVVIVVADSAVRSTQVRRIGRDGANVKIELPRPLTAGAWVLATAYVPGGDGKTEMAPRRAIGAVWLAAEQSQRTLTVSIQGPELAPPQRGVKIPVTVQNAGDEQVQLTLAAVDETFFQGNELRRTDPVAYFFGPRRLLPQVSDLYGQIIEPGTSTLAGAQLPARLPAPPIAAPDLRQQLPARPVALFSGIVQLDKSGRVELPLDLPEFEGRLHLVAVAWSPSRLGFAERSMQVRHPLSANLSLPAFLAPDDRAAVTLTLDNVDAPRGDFQAQFEADGAISIEGEASIAVNLAQKERRSFGLTLRGQQVGTGTLRLKVTGPNGLSIVRQWPIAVRGAAPVTVRRAAGSLKPGAGLTIEPPLAAGLRGETVRTAVTVSAAPALPAADLLRSLRDLDAESTEQLVDRIVPLAGPGAPDAAAAAVLQDVLRRLSTLQGRDGSFGQWSAGDDAANGPWLSAYVLDVLSRARTAGIAVPPNLLDRGLTYLAGAVEAKDGRTNPIGIAYAHAVLSREKRSDAFWLRAFSDRVDAGPASPVVAASLAVAFANLGDKDTAAKQAERALATAPRGDGDTLEAGSELRNHAAIVALLGEAKLGAPAAFQAASERLAQAAQARRQFTQQELAWLLRAARVQPEQPAMRIELDGKAAEPTQPLNLELAGAAAPALRNADKKPLVQWLAVSGVPAAAEPRESKGYELQRQLFDRGGQPVNPANIRQNDLLVVLLSGRFTAGGVARPWITDLLPGGWEIENPAPLSGSEPQRYGWLGELTPTAAVRARQDRFLAAPLPRAEDKGEFRVAYVVRAVTPGQFQLPAPQVEDLMRPALTGRGTAGSVAIAPR